MYCNFKQWYCNWEYFIFPRFPSEDSDSNNDNILEDTTDFLLRLNQFCDIPNNTLLIILTHHTKKVWKAWKYTLTNGKISQCRQIAYLGQNHSFFYLKQDVYYQILSTAIGTKFAPHYVNIFMAALKEDIFSNTEFRTLLWLRYLHDIFCLWTGIFWETKRLYWIFLCFSPFSKIYYGLFPISD